MSAQNTAFQVVSLAAALSFAALAPHALADEEGWSGEVGLTGSSTSGNSDTTDVGLSFKFKNKTGPWSHKFDGSFDYSEADSVTNKQRLEFGYKAARDIGERFYVFGNGEYFQDDFGAYDNGYFVGAGVGYKVILPEPVSWKVEAGPGFRSQETRAVNAEREDEIAFRGYSEFIYKFNDSVSLSNETEVIHSSSDTYTWNEIALIAKLFGGLAAKASFRVDHHTDVPIGREETDTITRIGVIYKM